MESLIVRVLLGFASLFPTFIALRLDVRATGMASHTAGTTHERPFPRSVAQSPESMSATCFNGCVSSWGFRARHSRSPHAAVPHARLYATVGNIGAKARRARGAGSLFMAGRRAASGALPGARGRRGQALLHVHTLSALRGGGLCVRARMCV